MDNRRRALVLGAFIADSLALGAHWIYDTDQLERDYGRIDRLLPPAADKYHPHRKAGEFTHYGDQSYLLLRHLAANSGFSLAQFARDWQQFASTYDGYIDQATKMTLASLATGATPEQCGSGSSDLGGPARLAPLIAWYSNDPPRLLSCAHEATSLTHTGSGIRAGTEFLIDTVLAVLDGASPSEAISWVLEEGVMDLDLDMRLRRALETADDDNTATVKAFGQMCSISASLPAAVHLILAHQEDLREALIANTMAGGDSAARGMVIGMILGAYQGLDSLDRDWLNQMRATESIERLLDEAP